MGWDGQCLPVMQRFMRCDACCNASTKILITASAVSDLILGKLVISPPCCCRDEQVGESAGERDEYIGVLEMR